MPESSSLLNTGPSVWLLLAVLLVVAGAVSGGFLGLAWSRAVLAGFRALAQLALVAVVISQVGRSVWLAAGFLVVMLTVASWTSARRIGRTPVWAAAVPILAGALPVAALLFATRVLPPDPLAVVAVVGQLIGGSMTASNLAGRRLRQELDLRGGEVEAGMALGLMPRAARTLVARPVASEALMPALDQTRTVGTVTLPGAFVGLVLGGAAPLDAGLVQLVVLVSLLAAESIAVTAAAQLTEAGILAGRPRVRELAPRARHARRRPRRAGGP
jgi:putative ABC transport system permease protein